MFKYKIIDDFLRKDDFNNLLSVRLQDIQNNEINIYHNKIFRDGSVELDCLDKIFINKLFNNYHDKAIKILNELNPKKVPLYEYSEFSLINTGANYKFPIHRDNPDKLLSGVIYLSPKINTGTILYENKYGKNKKVIEWKQNRALFFSRTESNSYHSYEGNKLNNRLALVYNLMTTDIKSVCRIEGVNYQKVRIREFINPYYNRLFKKIL